MEFLDGSWKKEVSSWDALMGEELPQNQESHLRAPFIIHNMMLHDIEERGSVSDRFK